MSHKWYIGIDLGTTNTVVSFAKSEESPIEIFHIKQRSSENSFAELDRLPSVLFLDLEEAEDSEKSKKIYYAGEYAAKQASLIPGRGIHSSKSWLSFSAVDRNSPILPWGASQNLTKLSPVEVSSRILEHIKEAWNTKFPENTLEKQNVVITIPASFDEVARRMTESAARSVGLQYIKLLEEPQAAFYNFLEHSRNQLHTLFQEPNENQYKNILVVDIGGGTTDLSLLEISFTHKNDENQKVSVKRNAVGDHLLLGGDNVDAALTQFVEMKLFNELGSLSESRKSQLTQSVRYAKETLLAENPPESIKVVLASAGRKLFSKSHSYTLHRKDVLKIAIDAFWPVEDFPQHTNEKKQFGLSSFGLPYEQNPKFAEHIADFLKQHALDKDNIVFPDAILLNGGVFKSLEVRQRIEAIFRKWTHNDIKILNDYSTNALGNAVSLGACYAARIKDETQRIIAGNPRAIFVESLSKTGEMQNICILPKGSAVASKIVLEQNFLLSLGKPVSFKVLELNNSEAFKVGDLCPESSLQHLSTLETVLELPNKINVQIVSELTEIGTIDLSLQAKIDDALTWKMDFNTTLQKDLESNQVKTMHKKEVLPAQFLEVVDLIDGFYGKKKNAQASNLKVKNLRRLIEKKIGERDQWSVMTNREIAQNLLMHQKRRRRTAEHEHQFFSLLGYCLRPGFGVLLDDWRIKQCENLIDNIIEFKKIDANWASYWLFCRRIAAGLSESSQEKIYFQILYLMQPQSRRKSSAGYLTTKALAFDEAIRCVSVLEKLDNAKKIEVSQCIWHHIEHKESNHWWAFGRVLNRLPSQTFGQKTLSAQIVNEFLSEILKLDWENILFLQEAMILMAQKTPFDNNISDEIRNNCIDKMRTLGVSEEKLSPLLSTQQVKKVQSDAVMGYKLPPGLILD